MEQNTERLLENILYKYIQDDEIKLQLKLSC